MKLIATIGRWLPIGTSVYFTLLSVRILISQESFSVQSTGHMGFRQDEAARALIILTFSLIAIGLFAWRAWARWLGAIVYSVLALWAAFAALFPQNGDDRTTPLLMGTLFGLCAIWTFLPDVGSAFNRRTVVA